MTTPFADRKTLDDATALMTAFGEFAGSEAALRADRSRDRGNAINFCHWRQVERLIVMLSVERVQGTVH
jgi:hypothetical protein